jgi:hypothetical protein
MQFCHITGCPGIARTGVFCEAHKSPTARTERARSDPWYGRKEWRGRWGIRRFKLKRNPICEVCNVNHATQVHHLRDEWRVTRDWFLFMGGYNMEYLQSLCAKCHSAITMNQIKERGLEGLQCKEAS